MKKFLKASLAGLLLAQLTPISSTILAQEESEAETSSSLEETTGEESVDGEAELTEEEAPAAAIDLTTVIENVDAFLTEDSANGALMAAKEDYIAFLEQVQIGDLFYGYDLGPSMAEVAEQFTAAVEPQGHELSENETILEYVYDASMYNASEDPDAEATSEESEETDPMSEESEESIVVESAETVEEPAEDAAEDAATDEEAAEEDVDSEANVTTEESEDEDILATFFVYFYDDEAIFTGLVSNYHDVDYEKFMAQAKADELEEANAPVADLLAEAPMYTGHGLTIQNESPVESFVTFSGTDFDSALIEFFMVENNEISVIYDEPLAAGGLGFDYLLYQKHSAYADGLSNEEARVETSEEEAVETPAEEEATEEEPAEEEAPEEESSEEDAPDESEPTEEESDEEESSEEESSEESSEEETTEESSEEESESEDESEGEDAE